MELVSIALGVPSGRCLSTTLTHQQSGGHTFPTWKLDTCSYLAGLSLILSPCVPGTIMAGCPLSPTRPAALSGVMLLGQGKRANHNNGNNSSS